MRNQTNKLLWIALWLIVPSGGDSASPEEVGAQRDIEKEILRITKDQWDAEIQGDSERMLKHLSADYTEFHPSFTSRLDLDLKRELVVAESRSNEQLVAAQMADAKVQVFGDVAVLSYNFLGLTESSGEINKVNVKSTRVYARQNDRWVVVHANYAPNR